jgi:transposase
MLHSGAESATVWLVFGETARAMTDVSDRLPNDIDALHALIATARAGHATVVAERDAVISERNAILAERDQLAARNERLEAILAEIRRPHFGRKSERISDDQLALALEELETAFATAAAAAEKADPALKTARDAKRASRRRASRDGNIDHLPHEEVVIEPESTACPCCGGALHVIGEDVSKRLDRVPARLRVLVTRRPKFACRSCEKTGADTVAGVIQAKAPARLIVGGLPTEALVADVVVSKYADHLPLYRQSQILARQGVKIDRSTLPQWVGAAAAELKPLHDHLVGVLKASPKLFCDETRCPVLDPGRGKTKTGYMWSLARDDRPWSGSDPPAVAYTYGPNLHRFVLALHFSGQVTCERILALLNGMGVLISKRQVVRLLTARLETFRAEDEAVLKAGLGGAYVTVDDTGARHAGKSGYTTQIGSDTFTVFRTGPSKSRLAFLSRLCGGTALHVINDAALDYMKDRQLPQAVIDKFADHKKRIFSRSEDWEQHLHALGLTGLNVTPDPVLIASEGALWGAIRHQGLLPDTVIVSDDAGQFRVGIHALCWVHADPSTSAQDLVHKLVLANDKQRNAIEVAKRMIWWFYGSLKEYKLAPSPQQAVVLRARFDRIFKRSATGYVMLDRLLRRLFRRKDALLRVLDHPKIPLNTNASENDIRTFVTKRKISGGTVSDRGRDARDIMLGLAKTCMKLKLSFYEFLGSRLGLPAAQIPNLAELVRPAPS